MKWSGEYTVNANDTDCNGVASASAILRYMQDAANREMAHDGPSFTELIERGLTFVLSRIRLSCYAPLYSHDNFTVETWACESKGVQFERCYRILRDGAIIAEAVSVWALCGMTDRRLHRVSEIEVNYCMDDMLELDQPTRIRIPEEAELSLKGERVVEYADIDLNMHMNNTHYPDILCSYLGTSMAGERVISMAISFVGEAPLGDSIKYYSGSVDGVYYVRSVRSDGKTNVDAEIILEPVEQFCP